MPNNTGYYREKTVTITKYESDGITVVSGYPHVYSMTSVFVYDSSSVTDAYIQSILDGDIGDTGTWKDLLYNFRVWVQSQEINLNIQAVQTSTPYGYDETSCPIEYGDYY